MGRCVEDELYEIGKRDGFDEAVAEIDRLTGGDGEYICVMGADIDERHCPNAEAMKQRIVARFNDQLETLKYLAPALLVLRNMCARAGLKMGEARAKEMIAELRKVLGAEQSP